MNRAAPLLCAGALAIVSSSASAQWLGSKAHQHQLEPMTVAFDPAHAIVLEDENTDFTLVRVDEPDATITGWVRAATEDRARSAPVSATTDEDGTLRVTIDWPTKGSKKRDHAHLRIEVPGAGDIRIKTGDGDVSVSGFACPMDVLTGDGDVSITHHAGASMHVQTGDGDVTISDSEGDVDVQTGDGDVSIGIESGSMRVQTGDGDVTCATGTGPATVRTGDGDVSVALGAGPLDVHTGDGDISAVLAGGFKGTLDASTNDGSISYVRSAGGSTEVRSFKRKMSVTIGDADETSHISSGDGDISVVVSGAG